MATCRPGDVLIAPPATIGGHVTHHAAGCAGLYGLQIHPAPVDADGYTVDLAALRRLALEVRPKPITLGGSLNLFRSEEHTSELQSPMRISYAFFCLQTKYKATLRK